jgi:hypothetical protein
MKTSSIRPGTLIVCFSSSYITLWCSAQHEDVNVTNFLTFNPNELALVLEIVKNSYCSTCIKIIKVDGCCGWIHMYSSNQDLIMQLLQEL